MGRADRARRAAVERIAAAAREGGPPDALYARVVEELAALMPVASACWHLNDPVTGVLARTGAVGEPPGSYEQAIDLELLRGDVARMADVVRRPVPVAVLSAETEGDPGLSSRYREMLAPDGAADELRAGFVDPFGCWGSIVLFGSARFGPEDAALVAEVVGAVAQGLRLAVARPVVTGEAEAAPAVLVLDAGDGVEAADERALTLMAELVAGTGTSGLPGVVHVLAAQARRRDPRRPARARVQTRDGRWYLVDASPLGEGPAARTAVVVQPAPAGSLADTMLLAHGLSAREREVAVLVLAGLATDAIAARLHVSPWTVQDHLKSIFEKVGVRSRPALVARVTTDLGGAGARADTGAVGG